MLFKSFCCCSNKLNKLLSICCVCIIEIKLVLLEEATKELSRVILVITGAEGKISEAKLGIAIMDGLVVITEELLVEREIAFSDGLNRFEGELVAVSSKENNKLNETFYQTFTLFTFHFLTFAELIISIYRVKIIKFIEVQQFTTITKITCVIITLLK